MLAQAQEAFLLKATAGKMREGTLAKLAMQVSTFYNVAHEIASQLSIFEKVISSIWIYNSLGYAPWKAKSIIFVHLLGTTNL